MGHTPRLSENDIRSSEEQRHRLGEGWVLRCGPRPDRGLAELPVPDRDAERLSPLNYFLLYGVPLGVALCVTMWRVVARAYRWARVQRGRRSVEYAWVLAIIGSLAVGLTGYSYGTDPMLWLGLGMLASLSSAAAPSRRGLAPAAAAD